MKINWKVRLKNPVWWTGLIGLIFTTLQVSPEMFTDWSIVWNQIVALVQNPFMLVSVVMLIIGYNNDHTTSGVCDSSRALNYDEPHKDVNLK